MSHDYIKFLPKGDIEVSTDTISFGSEQQLNARIFKLQDCDIKEDEQQHMLLYDTFREVGEIWVDGHTQAQIEDCVVLGRNKKRRRQEDYREYWYVLLVWATHENKYRRYGVGRIQPQYVSRTSVEGVLV
jgi:hypothetical protein